MDPELGGTTRLTSSALIDDDTDVEVLAAIAAEMCIRDRDHPTARNG